MASRFWDDLRSTVNKLTDEVTKQISKFKDANFRDASMAICALVAAADGSIDEDERTTTAQFIGANEMLKVFPVAELQEKFNFFCGKLHDNFAFGKIEAMQAIARVKSNPAKAIAVVQVGIIIGGADGDFDPAEKKVVREVCGALGIDSAQFDLTDEREDQGQHKSQEGSVDGERPDWMN